MESTSLEPVRAVICAYVGAVDDLSELPAVFATVPDPRQARGKRYALWFLLVCLTAALLSNCDSLDAVGQWCALHQEVLARYCGPRRYLTPTGSLFRWLLPRLSVADLEGALARWTQRKLAAPSTDALALDGKTARGRAVVSGPRPISSRSPPTPPKRRCAKQRWARRPTRSPWPKPCCVSCRSPGG